MDSLDDIQLYQEPSKNIPNAAASAAGHHIDYPNQPTDRVHESLHQASEQTQSNWNNENSISNSQEDTSPKFRRPWGSSSNSNALEASVSSGFSDGFVQYTSEDYKNHASWVSIEGKKRTKSKGSAGGKFN